MISTLYVVDCAVASKLFALRAKKAHCERSICGSSDIEVVRSTVEEK